MFIVIFFEWDSVMTTLLNFNDFVIRKNIYIYLAFIIFHALYVI